LEQATINPDNTVFSVKRLMGRRYDEPEVAKARQVLPYRIVAGAAGDARIYIPQTDKEHAPQEISAMILRKLKEDAESYLGEPVTQAVIEVENLVKEAKRHEAEDRRQKELIAARNQADHLTYQMEKTLREIGDQISSEDRQRIEQAMENLKQAKQGDDAAKIRQLIEQLQQASYAIGQQVYAQQQQAAASFFCERTPIRSPSGRPVLPSNDG
jgi:molecular chaperone DnaK (HSP70)